jgi:hypothetical protein
MKKVIKVLAATTFAVLPPQYSGAERPCAGATTQVTPSVQLARQVAPILRSGPLQGTRSIGRAKVKACPWAVGCASPAGSEQPVAKRLA